MAPKLYPTKIGEFYISDQGYWFYLMEFIDGRQMEEIPEDEYKIGQAARKLHALQGYFGEDEILREEYDLIFYGAMQMHISYMQSYGPDAVEALWQILLFGMEQKELLWEMLQEKNG